ncbi:hypothetical protein ACI782_24760 [Geodermatophilus sp. SYSU D00703]
MPVLTRPGRRAGRSVPLSVGVWTVGLAAVVVTAGIAGAAPALAVDDPTRPDARVTHGPSCRPGGVVIEVTGGTVAYAVTLATTRQPAGEAVAEVAPGAVVVLSTGEVDWGETIDPLLRYAALDGSGTAFVDELDGYNFTRPAAEDCAAIAAPPAAAEVPSPGTPPVALPDGGPLEPGGVEPAAVDAAPREAAAGSPLPGDDGVAWPALAAGFAVLAGAAGMAAVSGRRRARPQASPPCGPPPPGSA